METKSGAIYIIGNLYRVGALSFAVELEYYNYREPGGVPDNYNLFHCTYAGIPHYIIEIPQGDIGYAEDRAAVNGLVLRQGKPLDPTLGEFNLKAGLTYTLEYRDIHGSTTQEHNEALQRERQYVKGLAETWNKNDKIQ